MLTDPRRSQLMMGEGWKTKDKFEIMFVTSLINRFAVKRRG